MDNVVKDHIVSPRAGIQAMTIRGTCLVAHNIIANDIAVGAFITIMLRAKEVNATGDIIIENVITHNIITGTGIHSMIEDIIAAIMADGRIDELIKARIGNVTFTR